MATRIQTSTSVLSLKPSYKSLPRSHRFSELDCIVLCLVLTTISSMNLPVAESLSSFSVVCTFIIICSLSSLVQVQARQFYVGGRDGWVVHPKEDYDHWSGRNRFLINDTLLFKYKKGENSVLLVKKDGYDQCDAHDPIKKWDDGDTVFQLDRSGPFYFISGQDGNCRNGQKLTVVVLVFRPRPLPLPPRSSSPTPATAPGAAPGSEPPGSSTPATSPAPSTSPAPTPTHAPAMGPSSRSPSPTAALGSSTPATSPSPSTSPATTPTHAPAMGPTSLSPSPTAVPGSSTPATSPSPSTSPATTPTHAPATGPPSPSAGSPSSAPTATGPASGPTAPGAPGASPPAPSTTSPPPGGSAQSSPPAATPTGLPANVTSPPPANSAAQVVNPLGMWELAFLMMVLGQI